MNRRDHDLRTRLAHEAARLMDAQERVDTVPLPAEMRIWLESYVAEHYKPEPKKKRVKAIHAKIKNNRACTTKEPVMAMRRLLLRWLSMG